MGVERVSWEALPPRVRQAVQDQTGPIESVVPASAGLNSGFAVAVESSGGWTFVKGVHRSGPVMGQVREACISPFVGAVSPPVLWGLADVEGWHLLGFEYVPGRGADFSPGSADLPAVVELLRRLGSIRCPDDVVGVRSARSRWGELADGSAGALDGSALLHTDLGPENVLIGAGGRAHLVDWAWPTRGAGVVDVCGLACRLVAAGHSPASAQRAIEPLPAWSAAPGSAVVFSQVQAKLWAGIARDDPAPWKRGVADAAREWSAWCEQRPR